MCSSTLDVSWKSLLAELRKALGGLSGEGALLWWRNFANTDEVGLHINWARAARMLLAIPAGSSASECAFSSTGEMVTKKRTRLGDDTLEMMTIARHYTRRQGFDLQRMAAEIKAKAMAALKAQADASDSSGEEPENADE